ncbi:hypothetical protein [Parachitinimonas caeni]|uniref:DUF1579 domain-containing protein n=1 Tax=Parachitinimonas caeni TaxID=3031301 RepID=A0ABT7DZ51_9NEIS|nr:hypothetical protein [Parachitinimonas caeni]MDK2125347.1 hypothetical protein [Parachitinimonas caeni]
MPSTPNQTPHDGRHDFDFLQGHWRVDNQRLRQRLQGSHDWETFTAFQTNQALPGGIGNFDDFVANSWRPDYLGMSLRLFNPQTGLWSIYWLDNLSGGLTPAGILQPPVVGRFENGVGIFEGEDTLDGRPILVRYRWSDLTPDSARWEQAMSDDAGNHWEVNWRMLMHRLDHRPQ